MSSFRYFNLLRDLLAGIYKYLSTEKAYHTQINMSRENNKKTTENLFLDNALRPSTWSEYIGQENIKNNLHILLTAAKERKHQPEHILFYGPPGLGKTTLAYLISKEIGGQSWRCQIAHLFVF